MRLAGYASAWLVGIAIGAWSHPPVGWLVVATLACTAAFAALQWRPRTRRGKVQDERRTHPLGDALSRVTRGRAKPRPLVPHDGAPACTPGGERARSAMRVAVAIVLCALLGALRHAAAEPRLDDGHIASRNDQGSIEFRGRISAEPDVRDTGTQYRVAAEAVRDGPRWSEVHGTVLLQTEKFPVRSYGDSLLVTAELVTPPVLDDFDYRAWLAGRGVHSIARRPRIETTATGGGNPVRRVLIAVKSRVRRSIAASMPEPEASLATGILLGDDNGIPKRVYDAFRITNTSHVIAISGSNVALLVVLLSSTMGRLVGRREAVPAILLALGLYTALVGADAAVVRAAVMGGITVLGVFLGRPSEATTALFAAAWAMTLYRPAYLDDLGFQLSFAATIGLIAFSAPWTAGVENALARHVGGDRARSAVSFLGEAVVVTLAAQVTTWPVIAHQTGEISVVGLVANFLIVPAQPAVMVLGGLAALGGTVWTPFGQAMGAVAWLPTAYTIRVVEIVARAPMALVAWSMPLAVMATYYVALWAVARPEGRASVRKLVGLVRSGGVTPSRGRLWAAHAPADRVSGWYGVLVLAGACVLVWAAVAARPDGLLHVFALDVGQGDAILVVTPNGRRMLIDGGPGPSAALDGLGRHMAPWDRRLDVVVLTHPDADHVGGLSGVLDRYEVATIVTSAEGGGGADARAWEEAIAREGADHVPATSGTRLVLDGPGGVDAVVLWPDGSGTSAVAGEGPNNGSVVLRLQHGRVSMLLTGDIEEPVEERLLAAGARLDTDVLKVGHHGSDTSTGERFLRAVSPDLALISVGSDNGFGHPSPAVLERLADIAVRRTDQHGTIEVISDGSDVWVR